MSKKTFRDFSELRSLLKRTETEAEAQAVTKASTGTRHLPLPPRSPKTRRSLADEFIIETLLLSVKDLPADQLPGARNTVCEAMDHVNHALISIRGQLELGPRPGGGAEYERSWKIRATAALQHKVSEGQALQRKLQQIDSMLKPSAAPAPVKLVPTKLTVVSLPKPTPSVTAAYEIRSDVPRPRHFDHDAEWEQYPFEKLAINQSFRFGADVSVNTVKRLVSAAARHLGRRFSYRTEQDKVVAVWRVEGEPRCQPRRR